jgi:hypothetical protein
MVSPVSLRWKLCVVLHIDAASRSIRGHKNGVNGHGLSSRPTHAAIYDALRPMKDI